MALIKYKLGDLICRRREKYNGIENLPVRGVSREGFIPSKKSGKGTNQIFYKNDFVFNPARMELNSIAFNRDYGKALCSSTYEIFFVVKPEIILPEYLNLFVKRSEFARWCDFVSTGSVRECCHVEDISELEITLPPLAVQEKFVAVYNSLVENKKVYERGLDDLKLVCDGYIDKLKHTAKKFRLGEFICARREKYDDIENLPVCGVSREGFIPAKKSGKGTNQIFYKNDFVFNPARMELNSIAFNRDYEKGLCSSTYEVFFIVKPEIILPEYLNLFVKRNEFARWCDFIGIGSVRECVHISDLCEVEIPIPSLEIQKSIAAIYDVYRTRQKILERLKLQIKKICPILIKGSLDEGAKT